MSWCGRGQPFRLERDFLDSGRFLGGHHIYLFIDNELITENVNTDLCPLYIDTRHGGQRVTSRVVYKGMVNIL